MIKASELRKGNIIKNPKGEIIIVTSIADGVINESYEGPVDEDGELYRIKLGFSITEITAIPLTPEWLERCGFEYSKPDEKWYKSGSHIGPMYFIYQGTYGVQGLGTHPGNNYKYLHQLQNLFFALTGEELTINHEHLQIPG